MRADTDAGSQPQGQAPVLAGLRAGQRRLGLQTTGQAGNHRSTATLKNAVPGVAGASLYPIKLIVADGFDGLRSSAISAWRALSILPRSWRGSKQPRRDRISGLPDELRQLIIDELFRSDLPGLRALSAASRSWQGLISGENRYQYRSHREANTALRKSGPLAQVSKQWLPMLLPDELEKLVALALRGGWEDGRRWDLTDFDGQMGLLNDDQLERFVGAVTSARPDSIH